MSDTTDVLIRRIQKLLALTGSPNEHEAQSAAAKVQELLAAHGLEMAEVQARQAKGGTTISAPEARVKEALQSSAMYSYQQDLMRSIAANNFCYYLLTERTKEDPRAKYGTRRVKTHTLIGSHLNVTVATLMYDYLIQTMDRLLPWQGTEKRGKQALLWLAGCSDRLQYRLTKLRETEEQAQEEKRQASPTANALVTLKDVHGSEQDLNADFLYNREPGTTARNRAIRDAEWKRTMAERSHLPVTVVKARPETKAEQRKRENQQKRWQEQSDRRYRKFYAKMSTEAYRMGSTAGQDIGLDRQVDHVPAKKIA
jgi:hypothetical protein